MIRIICFMNITNTISMFRGCLSFPTINFGNLDTNNITNISNMFC